MLTDIGYVRSKRNRKLAKESVKSSAINLIVNNRSKKCLSDQKKKLLRFVVKGQTLF